MPRKALILAGLLTSGLTCLCAQAPVAKSFVGTVTAFKVEALQMEVKPDAGDAVAVTFTTETIVQRVPAGEKDLKKVSPIKITDVAMGDRVLVSLLPGGTQARRIVVMSANEIAKRNEQDTADWMKRGLSGIVTAKSGNQVTLKTRSFQGESQLTVTVSDKTRYRRYAPDSVRFVDARQSSLTEVAVGDQLRARGEKSADGLKVEAEEVVFGTFQTKAGTVVAVNPETRQITVKDMVTGKPLVVHITADSQLKAMPDLSALMAARGGQGGGAGGMTGGAAGAGGPRPGFDMAQMMERMPAAKLEDLKPGQTIVVSSTKGAAKDEITAITLLSNADFLIQMASRQTGRGGSGRGDMMNTGPSMGMGGLSGGLEGLGMPGMIP